MIVPKRVVTCFIVASGGRLLLLKRSDRVGSFQGRWAGVSGYIEGDEEPLRRAYTEIEEEVGLAPEDVRLVRQGPVLSVKGGEYHVHPFLFEFARGGEPPVRLDWEHTGYRWVRPSELGRYETVPNLVEGLRSVWPWEWR